MYALRQPPSVGGSYLAGLDPIGGETPLWTPDVRFARRFLTFSDLEAFRREHKLEGKGLVVVTLDEVGREGAEGGGREMSNYRMGLSKRGDSEVLAIVANLTPAYPQSDDYATSVTMFDLIENGRRNRIMGHASRTGVTSPGHPARPVYEVTYCMELFPFLWVFEGGKFIETCAWYDARLMESAK